MIALIYDTQSSILRVIEHPDITNIQLLIKNLDKIGTTPTLPEDIPSQTIVHLPKWLLNSQQVKRIFERGFDQSFGEYNVYFLPQRAKQNLIEAAMLFEQEDYEEIIKLVGSIS